MGHSFIYVSSATFYNFEAYFIKLGIFTDSTEYKNLSWQKKKKVDKEIINIGNVLHYMQMFRDIPKRERAIIGWEKPTEDEDENTLKRYFECTSAIVASKVSGVQISNITRCCNGERPSAGGFIFEYADEHIEVVNNIPKWYDH